MNNPKKCIYVEDYVHALWSAWAIHEQDPRNTWVLRKLYRILKGRAYSARLDHKCGTRNSARAAAHLLWWVRYRRWAGSSLQATLEDC